MSTYLVVKYNNSNKSYTAKDNIPNKPYINISNKYFPLTTETSGTGIKVKINNNIYKIIESYTTSSTYTETKSVTAVGNSSTSQGASYPILVTTSTTLNSMTFSSNAMRRTRYTLISRITVSNGFGRSISYSCRYGAAEIRSESYTLGAGGSRSYSNSVSSLSTNCTSKLTAQAKVNAFTLSNTTSNGNSGISNFITTSSYQQLLIRDTGSITYGNSKNQLYILVTNITKSTIPKTSTYTSQ